MKAQRLFDAITALPDGLVAEAEYRKPAQRPTLKTRLRRRWYIPAVAAALALCFFLGSVLWPDGATIGMVASAAYLAEYPDRAQAVSKGDINRENKYDIWSREQAALRLPEDYDKSGLNSFTQALVQAFFGDNQSQNRICSPANIYMALAMLAETADADSRRQILTALGETDIETLRSKANTLWNNVYRNDGNTTTLLANSLWLRGDDKYSYVEQTLKTLAENYYASSFTGEMGSDSYDQVLRDWMNSNTNDLLKDQIDGISLDKRTVMALVSTIYFKGNWSNEFNSARNTVDTFHSVAGDSQVTFMHQSEKMSYYWSYNFAAAVKSVGGNSRMWLVLPDEGTAPEELLQSDSFWSMVQGSGGVDKMSITVDLSVPKFDVSDQIDLTDALPALGITDVFDMYASDFTPLTTDGKLIYVSQALHGARLKIDEEGAEGAAYTLIGKGDGSSPPSDDRVELKLNRPFVFVLTNTDNIPLFVGIVHTPQ